MLERVRVGGRTSKLSPLFKVLLGVTNGEGTHNRQFCYTYWTIDCRKGSHIVRTLFQNFHNIAINQLDEGIKVGTYESFCCKAYTISSQVTLQKCPILNHCVHIYPVIGLLPLFSKPNPLIPP